MDREITSASVCREPGAFFMLCQSWPLFYNNKMKRIILICLLFVFPNQLNALTVETIETTVLNLIEKLALPNLSQGEKSQIENKIMGYQKDALVALIEKIHDPRIYAVRKSEDGTKEISISIGQRCEQMAYQIITPYYQRPEGIPVDQDISRPFIIQDWKKWTENYRQKNIIEIRNESKIYIQKYLNGAWKKGPLIWD